MSAATASAPPSVADEATARIYLEDLYGTADRGYFSLVEFPIGEAVKVSWFPTSELGETAHFIASAANEGRTIYAGVGLRDARLPSGRRGNSESVCGIPAVWADVDYCDSRAHAREDLPPDAGTALAIIREATPLPPSMIVDSGYGFYPLLIFREFWAFDDGHERARAAMLLRRYDQALHTRAGKLHVDAVDDLARVLKVPGESTGRIPTTRARFASSMRVAPATRLTSSRKCCPILRMAYATTFHPTRVHAGHFCLTSWRKPWPSSANGTAKARATFPDCTLLAGARAGFEEGDTTAIVERISANDRNRADRRNAVRDTYVRLRDGKSVSGHFGLRDAVGMDAASLARLEVLREQYRSRTHTQITADKRDRAREDASTALAAVPAFPVDVLPRAIRSFVASASSSIGCPADFVAVPLLALAEGTKGKSRRLVIRAGFEVSPGSWYGVIAEPGTGKSPGQKYALRLVAPLQDNAWQDYQDRLGEWEATPKDERGDRPTPEHFFITDSTGEALWAALASSAGVTQLEDELRRRLKSLDAYRQAGDRQAMLGLWSNAPVQIVRRTSMPVYIPFPVAPLCGGIQPGVLRHLRGEGDDAGADDGWVPRFLLSWPDAEPLELSDVAFDARTVAPAVEIFRGLRLDRDQPHDTTLSPAAFAQFKTWHAHNRRVQIESRRGLERQWAAKAPFHLERLALVLHLLAWPHEEQRTLSTETMRDAIELLEYFRDHLVRVLPAFGTRVTGGIKSRILRILRTSKTRTDEGWVTRSDLSNGLRTVTPDELTGALNELLLAKIVERDVKTTATKPGERWRLAPEPGRNRAGKDSENSDDFRRESVAAHESTRTEQENPKNLKNLNGVPAETRTTARPAAASSPSAGR